MRCVRSVPGCCRTGSIPGARAVLDARIFSAADGKVFEQRDGKQTCAAVHEGYHKRFSDASGMCPRLAHAPLTAGLYADRGAVRWPLG